MTQIDSEVTTRDPRYLQILQKRSFPFMVNRWTRTLVTERAVHIVGRLYLMIAILTKIDEGSQCKHDKRW